MHHIRVVAIAMDGLDEGGDEDEERGNAIQQKHSKMRTIVH